MINTTFLEKNIDACDWADAVWFNGEDHPGTPVYSKSEQKDMRQRQATLEQQLADIDAINAR